MRCETLFRKIDELYPAYLKVWEDVCNIESPTNDKAGVDAVCRYFVALAEKQGWEIEISRQDAAGDAACITMNPNAKKAPVCFSGHMDTVHPVGLFGTPAVRMDEEKIYGPGVIDCKGGCVSSFLAMDALAQIGFNERPIKLILQSDEETGSKTSGKKTVAFMCEKAKGAAAFLNTEGVADEKKQDVVLVRKGILRFCYHITGKAAHSSKCMDGANAIAEAAYKIIELEKMKDREGLTCNCGVIEGGTVANTVAEQCSFLADIRFKTNAEELRAREIVANIAETSTVEGCVCRLEQVSYRPAMEYAERNMELLNQMNEIYLQNGLDPRKAVHSPGGSDAAYITQAGIPCIDSLGVAGGRIHSSEEYAILKSLAESAKYMAAVAMCL
ncbi:MAG: M20/M25/M40 family metallo-hydrolase [Lachnospiraceae bacterium]|nr:M20/M25/M40 family metallo-hydrolase [Lachnospiraceae bacterium]